MQQSPLGTLSRTMDSLLLSYLSFAIAAIAVLYFFYSSEQKGKKSNLPPSPPSLPFLGHLHLFKMPLHHALLTLSSQYGDVILLRFGSRRVLVVSSPSAADECFTTNDVIFANRPKFPSLKHATYNYRTIDVLGYGPHLTNLRRIANSELLSTHRLLASSHIRSDEVKLMARKLFSDWKSTSSEGSPWAKAEMKSRLSELSLNVIMRMMAGKKYLNKEDARRFLRVVEEGFKLFGGSNIGDFLPVMRWVDFGGANKKLMNFAKERDELTQKMIDHERRRESDQGEGKKEEEKTVVGELLSLQKMDPDYYTDLNIKSFLVSIVSAGSDTSSNTIEWAMSLLLNNPTALRKAVVEIDAHVGKDRLINESDLSHLSYLQCIVTETIRLFPAGPLLIPHESTEECHVGGFTIPRGTILLVNAYAIHRDSKIWEEPSRFLPERFEGEKKRRWMISFGIGRRKCPGEGLALREIGLALGTLLQCFEWERVGKEEVDLTEGSGVTVPKALPLEALYKPRQTFIDVLSKL